MEKLVETMNNQVNNDAQKVERQPESTPGVVTADGTLDSPKPEEGAAKEKSTTSKGGAGDIPDSRGRSLSPELCQKYRENPYVQAINAVGDFTYTHKFYIDMYGYIHYGSLTYEEAYEKLGFKTSELGVNRALSAGKRAVKMAEDGTLYKVSPGKFNGTIPLETMQLDKMDQAEQIGQLEARIIYLETVNRTQKKTFSTWGIKR